MAKATKNISNSGNTVQTERALLDSWHPHIENAINELHRKFRTDTKFILTESDLKCWLFYYLQEEKPYIPFAVHTEITHYANHDNKKNESEYKYKFRDLSLLSPSSVIANEEFLREGVSKKDILSKGFSHNAPAIHFELKLVRESGSNNETNGLVSDIIKLKNYSPKKENSHRDFIIVCGSRAGGTSVKQFKTAAIEKMKVITNKSVRERLRLYLFDSNELLCLNGDGKSIMTNSIKSK